MSGKKSTFCVGGGASLCQAKIEIFAGFGAQAVLLSFESGPLQLLQFNDALVSTTVIFCNFKHLTDYVVCCTDTAGAKVSVLLFLENATNSPPLIATVFIVSKTNPYDEVYT